MRLIWKIVLWVIGILIGLVLAGWVAFQVSPYPSALLIRQMFNQPVAITDQKKYKEAQDNVTVTKDLIYPSKYKSNQFDLYLPKLVTEKIPIIVWAHGGGFVGGDKSGMKEFATYLAADTQVAVVAMNYQVAPDLNYPGQLEQMGELVTYLKKATSQYPQLDLQRVFVGGDSAGAQIAGQYALVQTNNAYAQQNHFTQTLDAKDLRGFLSYCGPVNLVQVLDKKSTNKLMNWFVQSVGWSLVGTKDWQNTPELRQASLVEHLTSAFPPAYITDGNAYSFSDEGQTMVKKLEQKQVAVTSLFFEDSSKEVSHEYQFHYNTKEAKLAYDQTKTFIEINK
ncbi:alpha/beta hydrolase [Enterococcus camelliae]|uniref:Alpha/beta hydrolase n=1 Tax=Enterococcus camelliae TaxID=453959 RepID=A0ABW5TGD7_9ENTE